MTKIVRVIDRRNALYGRYKYQVKPGAIIGGAAEPRKWCREKWGPPIQWVEHKISETSWQCWNEKNPRWTEVKRPGFSAPFIYIRDEADAIMFGLVWSTK